MGMVLTARPQEPRRVCAGRAAGFSLVENLFALLILGLLFVGIVPLFLGSARSNAGGKQLNELTNRARARAEQLLDLPFGSAELEVPNGAQQRLVREKWSAKDKRWYAEAAFPANDVALYTRTTRVRQFASDAIDQDDGDFELEDDEVLPGGTSAPFVHLKEIEVHVSEAGAGESGVLGPRRRAVVRFLRSS